MRIAKVPKYVKIEAIRQAERLGNYDIKCFQEKYTDFLGREIFEITLSTQKCFEFIPDMEIHNDWFDELYQLKSYVNKQISVDS